MKKAKDALLSEVRKKIPDCSIVFFELSQKCKMWADDEGNLSDSPLGPGSYEIAKSLNKLKGLLNLRLIRL